MHLPNTTPDLFASIYVCTLIIPLYLNPQSSVYFLKLLITVSPESSSSLSFTVAFTFPSFWPQLLFLPPLSPWNVFLIFDSGVVG